MLVYKLKKHIKENHMVKHDFYQLWTNGKLNRKILADYSKQYYQHVSNFARYISSVHSKSNDLRSRQILLENLIAEERGTENHSKLWRDFCSELGLLVNDLKNTENYDETNFLANKFFDLCSKSYPSGLAALYAYKYQIPDIAYALTKGLKEFYHMDNYKALKFFEVHKDLEIWQSEEIALLIAKLPNDYKEEVFSATLEITDALLVFLNGMMRAHNLNNS
jgi:pyrroloquinoline-quinone synthase